MNEQEKREKVIKALELCAFEGEMHCKECPYDFGPSIKCVTLMHTDALALLKAQEPRVLTMEEVRDEAEYMYLEKYSKTGSDLYECAIPGDWDRYGIELLMSEYDAARLRWSDYGKTWRCWSSRPTDEQRKAIPWQE